MPPSVSQTVRVDQHCPCRPVQAKEVLCNPPSSLRPALPSHPLTLDFPGSSIFGGKSEKFLDTHPLRHIYGCVVGVGGMMGPKSQDACGVGVE